MRSFQMLFLLLFLVFFFLTAAGSIRNLKQILKKNTFRPLRVVFWLIQVGLFLGFIYLYIYPSQPREAGNYPVYFYFNILLVTVVVFNFPMSVSMGLYSFLGRKGKPPVLPHIGFVLSIGLAVTMLVGTLVGSRQLKTEQVQLYFPELPAGFDDYRIVQLSDTHLGGFIGPSKLLERTSAKIDELNPDLLLFTGDLVNNFADELNGLEPALKSLTINCESYAILGNHDYGDYTNWKSEEAKQVNFEAILNEFSKAGVGLLRNEHQVLKHKGDSIFLAGVENWGHPPFPQYADLEVALNGIPENAFVLLMTHDPAHWESQVEGRKDIELTLSGHTHGMQWGIKLAGIPFSLAYLTRKNWGGLYRTGNSALYVNTGLGTVGVPWRLDMPGEITLITLKRGKIN